MYNKLIKHIRRKLEEKGEILDCFDIPEDKQIKYIINITLLLGHNKKIND
jgi:hypothetical protein